MQDYFSMGNLQMSSYVSGDFFRLPLRAHSTLNVLDQQTLLS